MAPLKSHPSATKSNVLFIGDSGMGKTGALASLAIAGYNLRIMDFDNGVDILANILKPDIPPYNLSPEASDAALGRIDYVTLTDKFKSLGGRMFPESAKAWTKAVETLNNWPGFGAVSSWTPKEILVLDSLTFAGRAATRFIMSLNGKLAAVPQWTDYGDAQKVLDTMLATLYSEHIKCSVLVLSHIREIGKKKTIEQNGKAVTVEEDGTRRGYAETGTGAALSPTVGRYFNGMIQADIIGEGPYAKRVINTVPTGNIGLKNSAPGLVKPQYKLDTGLAEYFTAVCGGVPTGVDTTIPKPAA